MVFVILSKVPLCHHHWAAWEGSNRARNVRATAMIRHYVMHVTASDGSMQKERRNTRLGMGKASMAREASVGCGAAVAHVLPKPKLLPARQPF
jgi:hypothetical protein